MLIRKIAKAPKRSSRFRSQKHLTHVRSHACVVCDKTAPIEAAHVRLGSGAGMGQKPHDWFTVSLCKQCHTNQHSVGELTFWANYNINPFALAEAFAKASPKATDIAAKKRELGL